MARLLDVESCRDGEESRYPLRYALQQAQQAYTPIGQESRVRLRHHWVAYVGGFVFVLCSVSVAMLTLGMHSEQHTSAPVADGETIVNKEATDVQLTVSKLRRSDESLDGLRESLEAAWVPSTTAKLKKPKISFGFGDSFREDTEKQLPFFVAVTHANEPDQRKHQQVEHSGYQNKGDPYAPGGWLSTRPRFLESTSRAPALAVGMPFRRTSRTEATTAAPDRSAPTRHDVMHTAITDDLRPHGGAPPRETGPRTSSVPVETETSASTTTADPSSNTRPSLRAWLRKHPDPYAVAGSPASSEGIVVKGDHLDDHAHATETTPRSSTSARLPATTTMARWQHESSRLDGIHEPTTTLLFSTSFRPPSTTTLAPRWQDESWRHDGIHSPATTPLSPRSATPRDTTIVARWQDESWRHGGALVPMTTTMARRQDETTTTTPKIVESAADFGVQNGIPENRQPLLFCFAVMMPSGYEFPLLRELLRRGLSLFACDEHSVFSDGEIELSDGWFPRVATENVGNLTCPYGGIWHLALNTEVFVRIWKKVMFDAKYKRADWTVKVDPDAVFLPERLRVQVTFANSAARAYLNNCDQGLHGPIEVISVGAMKVFVDGIDMCEKVLKHEWRDWGEDVFLRHCMRLLEVDRVDNYRLLSEDRCLGEDPAKTGCVSGKVAFHPFKDEKSWLACFREAKGIEWGMQ